MRGRSAAAWVGLAVVLVAVVGAVYLSPRPAAGPVAPSPAAARVRDVFGISFADARRGSVTVVRSAAGGPAAATSYHTSDGGATWTEGPRLSYLTARLVIQYAEGVQGMDRISADGGLTWRLLAHPDRAAPSGPPDFVDATVGWWITQTVGDPPDAATLWQTDDGGGSWSRPPVTGIPADAFPSQVRFVDLLHGVVVAALARGTPGALFVTADGGRTWRPGPGLASPLPGAATLGVTLLGHGSTLLAWLWSLSGPFGPNSAIGTYVLVSGDGGATWSGPRAGPQVGGSAGAPAVDDRGRLILLDGRRLWTSEDAGMTWTARLIQAPAGLVPLGPVLAGRTLFATATDETTGFVGPDVLMRSTDDGVHWDPVRLP